MPLKSTSRKSGLTAVQNGMAEWEAKLGVKSQVI